MGIRESDCPGGEKKKKKEQNVKVSVSLLIYAFQI